MIGLQASCYSGVCQDLDALCNATYTPISKHNIIVGMTTMKLLLCCPDGVSASAGPQECFNLNTAGQSYGNCGHTTNNYTACLTA